MPIDLSYFNNLTIGVRFRDEIYPYGIALFNKLAGFKDIKVNQVITKKQVQLISKLIYEDSKDSLEYYQRISDLEKQLMFFITICDSIPSLNLEEMIQLVDEDTHKLLQKLPEGNAYVCYHIINALIDRCVSNAPNDLGLIKLFKSGSRFSKEQLSKFCIVTGLISDENSIVDQNPIRNSLIDGLTEEMFFASAPGSRKGEQYAFYKRLKFFQKLKIVEKKR